MNIHLVDRTFLKKPKHYILQSLLAVIAVAVILYFVETITHAAIVAALGASSFIVFAMPKTVAAEPRRLIGGHIIGILCGLACYYGWHHTSVGGFFDTIEFLHWLPAAIAVGLSILLMTILNFEHPPAAGTALGIVTHGWSIETVIFVVSFAVSLAIVGFLLKKYLKNLCT
jgi:CBS-domain-containing membrane protein